MAEEQANVEKVPAGPREIVVRNADGQTFSTRLKNEKGQFVKKEKTMPSSRELTRRGRALLFKKAKSTDGTVTVSEYELMAMYMIKCAKGECNDDPKSIMAAAQCYKVVTARLLGKEPLSDEDREAQKDSNVIKFVLIPTALENAKDRIKKELEQPSKPSFIDAEIVPDKK